MPTHEPHHFACHLTWTGAARGATRDSDDYSREYRVEFEGKVPIVGSSAPAFRGDSRLHNPEDLLVAALSACHCLTYLALCARARIAVVSYEDAATGTMDRVERVIRFTHVVLRPKVAIAPDGDLERARRLHDQAHAACFIANSVNFPVRNEPTVFFAR